MNLKVKQLVHRWLNKLGWAVHRYRPSSDPLAMIERLLKDRQINLILDVGANQGQFASNMRRIGYGQRIVSFEPLQEAYSMLREAAFGDQLWTVAPRCAIGAFSGTVDINVSFNSYSSSILPIHSTLCVEAPEAKFIGHETVPICTLDEVVAPHVKPENRCLLKIDTQGYEWEVLDGAASTMHNVDVICLEASLVPLYEGQRLWLDYIDRLDKQGYILWDIHSAFASPINGRLLQVDLIFIKE